MITCRKCLKEKYEKDYFRKKDGYQPWCKECFKAYSKERNMQNRIHKAQIKNERPEIERKESEFRIRNVYKRVSLHMKMNEVSNEHQAEGKRRLFAYLWNDKPMHRRKNGQGKNQAKG